MDLPTGALGLRCTLFSRGVIYRDSLPLFRLFSPAIDDVVRTRIVECSGAIDVLSGVKNVGLLGRRDTLTLLGLHFLDLILLIVLSPAITNGVSQRLNLSGSPNSVLCVGSHLFLVLAGGSCSAFPFDFLALTV